MGSSVWLNGMLDQLSQMSICFVVYDNSVTRIWLSMLRLDDTVAYPVLDDRSADTITLADLTDVECTFGRVWRRDVVFVPKRSYHFHS